MPFRNWRDGKGFGSLFLRCGDVFGVMGDYSTISLLHSFVDEIVGKDSFFGRRYRLNQGQGSQAIEEIDMARVGLDSILLVGAAYISSSGEKIRWVPRGKGVYPYIFHSDKYMTHVGFFEDGLLATSDGFGFGATLTKSPDQMKFSLFRRR